VPRQCTKGWRGRAAADSAQAVAPGRSGAGPDGPGPCPHTGRHSSRPAPKPNRAPSSGAGYPGSRCRVWAGCARCHPCIAQGRAAGPHHRANREWPPADAAGWQRTTSAESPYRERRNCLQPARHGWRRSPDLCGHPPGHPTHRCTPRTERSAPHRESADRSR